MYGQRASQIDHRFDGARGHSDIQGHRMVGLSKQDPGQAVNELEALDWERRVTRDHGGLSVSTWTFLHEEWGLHIGIGLPTLVGQPHPAATWKRNLLRWSDHTGW